MRRYRCSVFGTIRIWNYFHQLADLVRRNRYCRSKRSYHYIRRGKIPSETTRRLRARIPQLQKTIPIPAECRTFFIKTRNSIVPLPVRFHRHRPIRRKIPAFPFQKYRAERSSDSIVIHVESSHFTLKTPIDFFKTMKSVFCRVDTPENSVKTMKSEVEFEYRSETYGCTLNEERKIQRGVRVLTEFYFESSASSRRFLSSFIFSASAFCFSYSRCSSR